MKLSDHVARAEHRVEKSRCIIERQREVIAHRRAAGHETQSSEKVLATLEQTHTVLERGLVALLKEQKEEGGKGEGSDGT